MKKILLVRMDKIGDLCVTLPVDRVFLDCHVQWFVAKGMEFIPEQSIPPRPHKAFHKTWSWAHFKEMIAEVRRISPDAVIVFQAPAWVRWAMFFARVPIRVGVRSKLSSFFLFNRGVRQKRSISDRHELAYNLDLIQKGFQKTSYSFESLPHLRLATPPIDLFGDLQKEGFFLKPKGYMVLHPGMAGSAWNWSAEKYAELISKIPSSIKIVVTGTLMDRPWVQPLQEKLGHLDHLIWLNEKLNLKQLMVLLEQARVVLAPSTGVIHIAAALQTPVVGIYSPRQVETPLRWGPLAKEATVFVPEVSGQNELDVMNSISTESVLKTLKKYF